MRSAQLFGVALTLAACGSTDLIDPPPPPATLPQLVELPLRLGLEDQRREIFHLVVDDHGSIIYSINTPGGDRLIRLDSTGKRTDSFAPTGSQPGEFTDLAIPFRAGDTILVFDTARLLFAKFLRDGTYSGDTPETLPRIPLAVFNDSVDEFVAGRDGRTSSGMIVRRALNSTRIRPLLNSGDSLLIRTLGQNDNRVPVWASGNRGSVLADPISYRLFFFWPNGSVRFAAGREIPPNRRGPRELALRLRELELAERFDTLPDGSAKSAPDLIRRKESAATDTIVHFVQPGMQFDGQGRLWIIGTTGDTTFADVFADTTFLGRTLLPCIRPSSVSINNDWLAVACTATSMGGVYPLHLYRVKEPEQPSSQPH